MSTSASTQQSQAPHGTVKETLTSVTIAFVMAFVFRAFVIEAFVIPTGSMAPTLLGAHMRFTSPKTGFDWPVGPWSATPPNSQNYNRTQSSVTVSDPMSDQKDSHSKLPLASGDRILVLKYLYSLHDPKRFDVVVFKSPEMPQTNFIKRLTGLPGEQIALVDGDIFSRKASVPPPPPGEGQADWSEQDWAIARKPERVQRSVWQPVYDSAYTPAPGERPFVPPWTGATQNWDVRGKRIYTFSGTEQTTLAWDDQRWPISDRYSYNEIRHTSIDGPALEPDPLGLTRLPISRTTEVFPVSDLRMRCGIEPDQAGLNATAIIQARNHEFRAEIQGTQVTLRMRHMPRIRGEEPQWTTLDTATLAKPLEPGRVTNVEFWHSDQSLSLFVDSKKVAHGVYDWTPSQRIWFALGLDLNSTETDTERAINDPRQYRRPAVRWEFDGSPFKLYRVGLDRDIHYQAGGSGRRTLRATHPSTTLTLNPDQFFVNGDNSPASSDGRMWNGPDAWVAETIDPTWGVVPRDLLIGKAFFVYFPSLMKDRTVPVPDFGRMRFIR